ncbi:hypothetical protein B0H13DRAFT_1899547 [Mycena leptocephala]|nr:hypothetical protein B0H13DRAFT_1899547 [Mycena leptocephala]
MPFALPPPRAFAHRHACAAARSMDAASATPINNGYGRAKHLACERYGHAPRVRLPPEYSPSARPRSTWTRWGGCHNPGATPPTPLTTCTRRFGTAQSNPTMRAGLAASSCTRSAGCEFASRASGVAVRYAARSRRLCGMTVVAAQVYCAHVVLVRDGSRVPKSLDEMGLAARWASVRQFVSFLVKTALAPVHQMRPKNLRSRKLEIFEPAAPDGAVVQILWLISRRRRPILRRRRARQIWPKMLFSLSFNSFSSR